MKNKRGSMFLGIALGLFMFIMGVLILPYLTDNVSITKVAMSCTDTESISGGNQLACLFTGAIIPYYIWFFTSLTIGLLLGGRS